MDATCQNQSYVKGGVEYCRNSDWGYAGGRLYDISGDSWSSGYGYRNCTDWVAFRIWQLAHVKLPSGLGDASSWKGQLIKLAAATTTDAPQKGDIAWESGGDHVAVVESVAVDSHGKVTVHISEFNHLAVFRDGTWWGAGTFDERDVAKTSFTWLRVPAIASALAPRSDPAAVLRAHARDKIVTVSSTNTSYFYDGKTLHWIPDTETYWCVRNVLHKGVVTVPSQAQAALPGSGKPWQPRCFDPARIINRIVRESSSGTAYVVDGTTGQTIWHWIPDASTYDCLLGKGYTVVSSTWDQIDTLRHEGAHATCTVSSAGPVITGVSGNTDVVGAPPNPVTVTYQSAGCNVTGGTWTDQNGTPHDFGVGGPRDLCSNGVGSLVPGDGSCTSPSGQPGQPGQYGQTIVLRDSDGHVSAPYAFPIVCTSS